MTASCAANQLAQGLCTSGTANGGGVDVTGNHADGEQDIGAGSGTKGKAGTKKACAPAAECVPVVRLSGGGTATSVGSEPADILFAGLAGTGGGGGAPGVAATAVTAQDVARFLPIDGVVHTEPDGWAVVGVPANVWVDLRTVTVPGTVLGVAADVRFTPVSYRWDYGDGATRSTTTAGASWSALGQQQLTATSTSHVYEDRGSRRVSVEALYSAEYRVGGGAWLPVVGVVIAQEPTVPMQVVVEGTVLTTAAP